MLARSFESEVSLLCLTSRPVLVSLPFAWRCGLCHPSIKWFSHAVPVWWLQSITGVGRWYFPVSLDKGSSMALFVATCSASSLHSSSTRRPVYFSQVKVAALAYRVGPLV
ncbi:hypothetical protein DY000_02006933 [Brassica cretica]|uniref:Secreted protein n=1 Tax=Brassica cretica TaxID=69181 RepID=A0ABQ7CDX3_BRACR|nr:hypothetical protein DY000_02006933 [Brassica cretica]